MSRNTIIEMQSDPHKDELKKVEKIVKRNYQPWPTALKLGAIAGILMSIYLLILQASGVGDITWLKFLKYIFLFAALGIGLNVYRKANTTDTFILDGIKLGALTTFISAIVIWIFNTVISVLLPDLSFNKFNQSVDVVRDLLITNVAIFVEVMILGIVWSFIFLLFLKGKNSEGEITR